MMSDVTMRRMHCPQCNEQISPLRALFGLRRRPFDCSRCGTELEIGGGTLWLVTPALLVFWRVKAEYGVYSSVTWTALLMLCMAIAAIQLLLTPVRRHVSR